MNGRVTATVISQEILEEGIRDLRLRAPEIASLAKPGQFVNLYCRDSSRILPRPISICEVQGDKVRLVYRVMGEGTKEFSGLKKGDTVDLMGPLGNGFPLKEGVCALIGGGVGIPPLLEMAKRLPGEKYALLGYRNSSMFLLEDFVPYARVLAATEDGSFGVKGNVIDILRTRDVKPDVIYACGPKPMLKAVQAYAKENGIPAYLSLEERMACGIGACLGCVCHTTEVDEHSRVDNRRVCKDGPVFEAREVVL